MLTERDRALLEFEEQRPAHTGQKQNEIRERFGMSAPRYYSALVRLTSDPDAVRAFPQLAARLLRRQEAQERARRQLLRRDDQIAG